MKRDFLPAKSRHISIHILVVLVFVCLQTLGLAAQQPDQSQPPEHHHPSPAPAWAAAPANEGWTWSTDANVFVDYNYQERLFADFAVFESQSWFMVSGRRKVGPLAATLAWGHHQEDNRYNDHADGSLFECQPSRSSGWGCIRSATTIRTSTRTSIR